MLNKKLNQSRILKSLMLVLLIIVPLSSAITIYSGEPVIIELEKPFTYYSIVGNSTEVILDITQVGNNVTIIPDKYSLNDSYEIVFFDIEKEVITVYQSSGGGGGGSSKTKYVDRNITKYITNTLPGDIVEVEVEVPGETIEVEVEKSTGFLWFVIIILGVVILSFIFFRRNTNERRYKNKNEQENYDSSDGYVKY